MKKTIAPNLTNFLKSFFIISLFIDLKQINMKPNFTHSTKTFSFNFLIAFLLFLVSFTNSFGQNSYDGNYCPGPGVSGDEYATGVFFSKVINAGASTTCAINTVYAKVNTSTSDLRVGIKIGNSGAALFRMYIDSDNNPTTGLTTDSFGGSLAVAGAEYILELNAKSNSTYTLYQATGASTKVVVTGSLFNASNGNSLGCSASDGAFLEFYIPFGAIGVNICDQNNPGVINIAKLASVKGGSPTSDLCSDIPLTFGIPLKGSVGPNSTVCSGTNSSNLAISGLTSGSTVTKWQFSVSPFTSWTDIANTTTSHIATNLSQTTKFRAVISNTVLCSNTFNSSEATITVSATPIAVFATANNITVACGAATTSSLSYTNGATCLISGSVTSTLSSPLPGACGGTVTESWTFTDTYGRTITQSRIITISPAALPTMTAPAAIEVACGALPESSTISFSNGLSGGCLISGTSNASTFTATPNACGGTVTETWTATDSCGRALAPVSRVITVSPTAVASFASVSPITVDCGAATTSSLSYTNGKTGACEISGSVTSTLSATPGQCGGNITESWTYTDSCNRTITQSRVITV
ncbi:MAG: hypothetical protein ACKVOD_04745, partial [Flavobacterium sp.]